MTLEEKNVNKKEDAWWQAAFLMFLRLSVWVVAPIVLATLLGKYLDDRFATEPWILVGSVGVSFVLSIFMLIRETIKEYKKIEDNNKKQ